MITYSSVRGGFGKFILSLVQAMGMAAYKPHDATKAIICISEMLDKDS